MSARSQGDGFISSNCSYNHSVCEPNSGGSKKKEKIRITEHNTHIKVIMSHVGAFKLQSKVCAVTKAKPHGRGKKLIIN